MTVKNNGSHIFVVYQNHLESLLKYRLWDETQTYISNKSTGVANAAVPGNVFWELLIWNNPLEIN